MNSVSLVGRLVKDPEVRYTTDNMAIARFTLAVDRPMKKDEADFIGCVCFGKTAELVEKYVKKGHRLGINGRIQTGSYEKEGKKYYTTDVVAERVEFLTAAGNSAEKTETKQASADQNTQGEQISEGFEQLTEDDLPF